LKYYSETFNYAKGKFDPNRERYEEMANVVQQKITGKGDADFTDFYNTIGDLSKLNHEDRKMALAYIKAKVNEKGGIGDAFRKGISDIVSPAAKSLEQSGKQVKQLLGRGEDLAVMKEGIVPESVTGKLTPEGKQISDLLHTTIGNRSAIFNPFARKATPEETANRRQAAIKSGEYARVMQDLEQVINTGLMPDDIEGHWVKNSLNTLAFGSTRMAPGMIYFAATSLTGAGMARSMAPKAKLAATWAGLTAGYAGNSNEIAREHFSKFMSENPNMDAGLAYEMASISNQYATALETLSENLISSVFPKTGKFMGLLSKALFKSRTAETAVRFVGGLGIETATEVAQDFSADIVHAYYESVYASLPDVDLSDKLSDAIAEAPDIALTVSPYIIMGAGYSHYMHKKSVASHLNNATAMINMGIPEDVANDIANTKTVAEAVKKFEKAFEPIKAMASLKDMVDSGKTAADMMPIAEMQMAQEIDDSVDSGSVVVFPIKDESKNVTGWGVSADGGKPEVFATKEEASERATQHHEEKAEKAESKGDVKQTPQEEKAQLEREIADLEAAKAKATPTEEVAGIDAKIEKAEARVKELEEATAQADVPRDFATIQKEIDALRVERDKLSADRDAEKKKSDELGHKLPSRKHMDLTNQIVELNSKISALVDELIIDRPADTNVELDKAKKDLADLKAERDALASETTEGDAVTDAKIADKKKRIAEIDEQTKREQKEDSEKKEEKRKKEQNTQEEDTIGSDGKETKKTVPNQDQSSDAQESQNRREFGGYHAYTTDVLNQFGAEVPAKQKFTWADELQAVVDEDPNLESVEARIREILSSARVDRIYIHDEPSLMLYIRKAKRNIVSMENDIIELSRLDYKGNKDEIARLEEDLEAEQNRQIQAMQALDVIGSEAGRIFGFRQMMMSADESASFKIRRMALKAGGGKVDKATDAKINKWGEKMNKVEKELREARESSAKKANKVSKKQASEVFNSIKEGAGRKKLTGEQIRKKARDNMDKRDNC
jgi:hypothetical protein